MRGRSSLAVGAAIVVVVAGALAAEATSRVLRRRSQTAQVGIERWAREEIGVDAGPMFFLTTRAEAGGRAGGKAGRRVDPGAVRALVARLAGEVAREPIAARVSRDRRTLLQRAEAGYALDRAASVAALTKGLLAGELVIDLVGHETFAPVDLSDVRDALAGRSAQTSTILGTFSTRYRRAGPESSRAHNVELAASLLDGATIPAEGELSFNARIGERSESAGFRIAHVIEDGEMVDGVGGGTCQVASTLHAAAFFAGLELVEHHPHSRPSSYIPMGLDATVVWPSVDLVLRNPFPFALRVVATARDGQCMVSLLGAMQPRETTWERRVLERVPFGDRVVDDASVAQTSSLVSQDGIPGYLLERTRIITNDRGERTREVRLIRYPPTPRVVRIPPK